MTRVLVVNAGSSSLKFALLDPQSGQRDAEGIIERIGEDDAIVHAEVGEADAVETVEPIADHAAAFAAARERLESGGVAMPTVVGHRVVHGGDVLTEPTVIDDAVVEQIEACVPLAPLHNPGALSGIAAARDEFPDATHVAVFDTAFHSTMPDEAREYAIDRDVAAEFSIRRYGFHGTSHRYVAQYAAEHLGRDLSDLNIITLHLGNGASACAVRGGRSVETSMGVTPLEGLVMGTRSGDIDASVPAILGRAGWDFAEVDDLLNRRGGLKGMCGANDMREINARADEGDEAADLARQVLVHRLRKYIGAYSFVLGRVDVIVFTAGVGEHDEWVREHACADLAGFGIELDKSANDNLGKGIQRISTPESAVEVFVIPTDEEFAIAKEAVNLLSQ
jgi:acetate kinase